MAKERAVEISKKHILSAGETPAELIDDPPFINTFHFSHLPQQQTLARAHPYVYSGPSAKRVALPINPPLEQLPASCCRRIREPCPGSNLMKSTVTKSP
ncbi:MAG: hypothetical protein BWX50_01707 [Euryarchaeota archaeon ADurb.Bin009]|nr:MAG: hypothetical protein BWX50_01707 [Euryarchaeota archaeon ADurb.Bin009]